MNVFITFIVGGGLILSGIAWIVDRVAARTSTPVGEQRLAAKLGPISYPRGGLLVDDITVLAQDVPGADDEPPALIWMSDDGIHRSVLTEVPDVAPVATPSPTASPSASAAPAKATPKPTKKPTKKPTRKP